MTVEDAIKVAPLASAIIAGIAAIIAAIAATFACVQMRLARKTAVLQLLQSFNTASENRESALAQAETQDERDHAFHEFVNFLELYAGVCNRRLVTGLARELVRDRLIDSVVVIERAEPEWRQKIDQAIFHSETFGHFEEIFDKTKVSPWEAAPGR